MYTVSLAPLDPPFQPTCLFYLQGGTGSHLAAAGVQRAGSDWDGVYAATRLARRNDKSTRKCGRRTNPSRALSIVK